VNARGEPEYVRVKTDLLGSRGVQIPIGFGAVVQHANTSLCI